MSRQDQRGLNPLRAMVLALALIGQAAIPAVARQAPPRDRPLVTKELKEWREDFSPGREANSFEISIWDQLHPQLVEIFGDKGFTCELDGSLGALTRERPGQETAARSAVTDEIPVRVKSPGAASVADPSGWIELEVPKAIARASPDRLKLTIHGWSGLRTRLGAGVFSGSLTLRLRNPALNAGKPIRFIQRLTVVIVGSRIVSAPKFLEPLRVGTKPTVEVVIESVRTVKAADLEPGWWLKLDDAKRLAVLARVPLPIPVEKSDGVRFRISKKEDGDDRCWDMIEKLEGEGYDRVEDWKNELILQHIEPKVIELENHKDVSVNRYTVSTYLPALFQPGDLLAEVFWDPAATTSRPPHPPDRPNWEIATRKSVAAGVGSGLRVSTDMPLTGETFWIWAVTDLAAKETPPELDAYISKADRPKEPVYWIKLEAQPPNPDEPNLSRYRGSRQFRRGETGDYRVKLYNRDDVDSSLPLPEGETKAIPPPEWIAAFLGDDRPMRVVLEGVTSDSPWNQELYPLKVFVGDVPVWWLWWGGREPGFQEEPYANYHKPGHLFTSRALTFRRVISHDEKPMGLRYQGIFFRDETSDGQPASVGGPYEKEREPTIALKLRRWDGGAADKGPQEAWAGGSDPEGQAFPSEVPPHDPDLIPLQKDASQTARFQFFDFQIDLVDAQQERARKAPPQPLLARFVIAGVADVDKKWRPFGRVYQRPFTVVVRTMGDEFWDMVSQEWQTMALGGLILAVAGIVLYRRFRRRRTRHRTGTGVQDPDSPGPIDERDYFKGMAPARPDHYLDLDSNRPAPSEAPPPTRGPAPPQREAPEPSYLEDLRSEGEPGGPSYLD